MKKPKYLLRVGAMEFVIAHNQGVASLMKLMEDAMPVHADLSDNEITLLYLDQPDVFSYATEVRLRRLPPGVKWKQKTKQGEIIPVVPEAKPALRAGEKPLTKSKRSALPGRKSLQLEFGR